MVANNDRYDLSDRLVHFFRQVNTWSNDSPMWPQDLDFASIAEEEILEPHFLLRHAIRMGRLYATWSLRDGRRTIYGDRPAVCFTEMPIPAFIEAGRSRAAAGQKMSAYGIVLKKSAAFGLDVRPAIYSLTPNESGAGGDDDTLRLLPEELLPLHEQYRYVAYNPSVKYLDWTHEREWRWRLSEEPWRSCHGIPPENSKTLPGFNLDHHSLTGSGIIVATETEAKQVIYDVLTKVDRGDIKRNHYSFVLAHETIKNWDLLRARGQLEAEIDRNAIDLGIYFQQDRPAQASLVSQFEAELRSILKQSDGPTTGERGGCWLWVLDNTHDLVRALVDANLVEVNQDGKYLVEMKTFAKAGYSLDERKEMTKELALRITKKYGIAADYFYVRRSEGIDDLPFSNGDQLDNRLYYNVNAAMTTKAR